MKTLNPLRYKTRSQIGLIFYIFIISGNAFAQSIPSAISESLARRTTLRLNTTNHRIGTGSFIHLSGLMLTSGELIGSNTEGIFMLDNVAAPFKVVFVDEEADVAFLVAKDQADAPKNLPNIKIRDASDIKEGDFLLSRSGINEGPLCTWVGWLARVPENRNKGLYVVQTTFSQASRGAPFLDVEGNYVGFLAGAIEQDVLRYAKMKSTSFAFSLLEEKKTYEPCFNSVFKDYILNITNLAITHTKEHSMSQVLDGSFRITKFNDIELNSLLDLKLLCWVASEQGQDHINLSLKNDVREELIRLPIPSE